MTVPIAPLIPIAAKLLIELIVAARAANEIDQQKYEDLKEVMIREFTNIPKWKDL